jgi:hypothetical protein
VFPVLHSEVQEVARSIELSLPPMSAKDRNINGAAKVVMLNIVFEGLRQLRRGGVH